MGKAIIERLKLWLIAFNKAAMTRQRLLKYLDEHRMSGLTLDVGGRRGGENADYYERGIVIDICRDFPVDVQADVHMMPFRDGTFDSILCTEVLEHVKRPWDAVDEMHRVLRDGGRMLLTCRFMFPLHDQPQDFFRFTKFGLRHLLRKWRISGIEEADTSFETLAIIKNRFMADKQLHPFLRAMFLFSTLLWLPFARLASRVAKTDCIASGYFVDAVKDDSKNGSNRHD